MDAILFNLLGDIPAVTKTWTLGSLALSVLTTAEIIEPTRIMYNYELAFKKGQYERILFSLFDFGQLDIKSLVNLCISCSNLSMLENSFQDKNSYIWVLFLIFSSTLSMTAFEQPIFSLASLMNENLVYYRLRKNPDNINFQILAGFNISPLVVPLYMNAMLYFVYERSLFQVAMNFIPGHLMFFMDDIVGKIYDIDFTKSPYTRFIEKNDESENDEDDDEEQITNTAEVQSEEVPLLHEENQEDDEQLNDTASSVTQIEAN